MAAREHQSGWAIHAIRSHMAQSSAMAPTAASSGQPRTGAGSTGGGSSGARRPPRGSAALAHAGGASLHSRDVFVSGLPAVGAGADPAAGSLGRQHHSSSSAATGASAATSSVSGGNSGAPSSSHLSAQGSFRFSTKKSLHLAMPSLALRFTRRGPGAAGLAPGAPGAGAESDSESDGDTPAGGAGAAARRRNRRRRAHAGAGAGGSNGSDGNARAAGDDGSSDWVPGAPGPDAALAARRREWRELQRAYLRAQAHREAASASPWVVAAGDSVGAPPAAMVVLPHRGRPAPLPTAPHAAAAAAAAGGAASAGGLRGAGGYGTGFNRGATDVRAMLPHRDFSLLSLPPAPSAAAARRGPHSGLGAGPGAGTGVGATGLSGGLTHAEALAQVRVAARAEARAIAHQIRADAARAAEGRARMGAAAGGARGGGAGPYGDEGAEEALDAAGMVDDEELFGT